MFDFNSLSSLLLPGVATGTLAIGGLLLRAWRRRTAPDLLLALLLLPHTLVTAWQMLRYAGWAAPGSGYWLWWLYFPWFLSWGVGPVSYIYFRSLTNQDFRWRELRRHLWPMAMQVGIALAMAACDLGWQRAWLLTDAATGPALHWWNLLVRHSRADALLSYGLLLYYSVRGWREYRRYHLYLNDNFSNQERLRFEGLRDLLVLQLLGLTISVVFTSIALAMHTSEVFAWAAFFLRGMLIYVIAAVGLQANYAAATSPLAFEPDEQPSAPALPAASAPFAPAPAMTSDAAEAATRSKVIGAAPDAPNPAPNQAATSLAPELVPWREKLLHLMQEQQPWREPDLHLTELAQRLKLHPAQLSKVLNAGLGQSFSDFINGYRVREALRLLADPARAHYSLVGIALESGFNSKSTFNRVFKNQLGYPPSEVPRPNLAR